MIIMAIMNFIIHTLGCTLLINIYRKERKKTVQQLYLICHSLVIAVKNVLALLLVILEFLPNTTLSGFKEYLAIIFGTVTYCYYSFMFFLTSDRLAGIILNFRYPVCWSIRKAKYLVASTIFINLILCVGLSITYGYLGEDKFISYHIYAIFYTYIPTTLDISFLALAIVTYTVIFIKYSESRRLPSRHKSRNTTIRKSRNRSRYLSRNKSTNQPNEGHPTLSRLLFKSRFLISILLISSFLLFSVVPGLIIACFETTSNEMSYILLFCIYISFKVSDAVEAIIYIFLQRKVRKLLLKKIQLGSCKFNGNAEEDTSDVLVLRKV